jgi:hypothetical protein
MRRGTGALALAILDIVGYAVLAIVSLESTDPDQADPVSTLLFGGAIAAFSSMGALLVRRVPANPIGALLLGAATAQVAGIGVLLYGSLGGSAIPPWPGAAIAFAFGDLAYLAPFVIALVGIPLLFPDGGLPSPRFRWVARVTAAGLIAMALVGLASLVPGLADVEAIAGLLVPISVLLFVFGFAGAATAMWVRFKRGDPVQRQQLKWLLADAALVAVVFPPALVLGPSEAVAALAFWVIGFLAFLALPVAIAIAILQYRLYDIDRIVSRTIGYAIVTVALAGVFVGAILAFQAVLAPLTVGNTVAVSASTLVAASLFQPLRRRVQVVVDRRFNRAHYDAERTAAAFAARLRDEIDLATLGADVTALVQQTVAPSSVALWIRRSGG